MKSFSNSYIVTCRNFITFRLYHNILSQSLIFYGANISSFLRSSRSMGINKINFKFLYSQFGELPPGAECKIKMTYIMELPVERNMVIVKLTTPTTVPPRFTPLFKHCKLKKNLHSVIVIESHAIVPSLCWYFIFWLFVKITLMIQYAECLWDLVEI